MSRILVVDNYDSFAYNLVQYVGEFADEVIVRRNDAVDVDGIEALAPDGIVVSPGPGTPASAGVSMPIFADLAYPTLGVCLGHQALCAVHGATVGHAPEVVHGKSDCGSGATTRLRSDTTTYPTFWRRRPGRTTRPASSWASATGTSHTSASSFTPRAS